MQRMPACRGWPSQRQSGGRRSPVEIIATMGTYMTRTHAAEVSGLRAGPFGRWADGVTAMRADCVAFAGHWQAHNEQVLQPRSPGRCGWSSATPPRRGSARPARTAATSARSSARCGERTGLPWRVLNLSVSGALIRDVLNQQLPRVPASADLVTCGIGFNDIMYTGPGKLFYRPAGAAGRGARPDRHARPAGAGRLRGPARPGQPPYVARINRTIHQAAAARGLPVAEVSGHFLPPWAGKFASDCFHPSQDGYRDWTRAVLAAI